MVVKNKKATLTNPVPEIRYHYAKVNQILQTDIVLSSGINVSRSDKPRISL